MESCNWYNPVKTKIYQSHNLYKKVLTAAIRPEFFGIAGTEGKADKQSWGKVCKKFQPIKFKFFPQTQSQKPKAKSKSQKPKAKSQKPKAKRKNRTAARGGYIKQR